MEKILVIGLDGVSWDLIKPWADEGELPTLNRLMKEGVWANLESSIPPTTGAAWVSFATGRNPGKHGIFDFFKFKGKTYERELVGSGDIKSKTYYEELNEKGFRSILVNLPVSYPPKKINGIVITSFLTQDTNKMVYPPEIRSRYSDGFSSYKLFPDMGVNIPSRYIYEYMDEVLEIERTRFAVAKSLFLNEEWDQFFLLFSGTDWISHYALGCFSGTDTRIKDAFKKQFREMDNYIKWFLENIGSEVNLFLISDHGQAQMREKFFINNWLCQKGYTVCKASKSEQNHLNHLRERKKLRRWYGTVDILVPRKIGEIAMKTPIKPILGTVVKVLKDRFGVRFKAGRYYVVDKAGSKAFCNTSSSYGIFINDKVRFENGVVDKEEYEEVRETLICELTELNDAYTGGKLFEHIWRKEEVYNGLFVDQAPDIILLLCDGVGLPANINRDSYIQGGASIHGYHTMNGIFLAHGPDVKQGEQIADVKIYDIAPTILHMFGLPISGDMDGRVLNEIFKEGSQFAERNVEYIEPESVNEQEKIKARVKGLKASGKIQ
jgi:predicted AlkP superfamily phosphohydrolase/phosphomutase